MARLIAGVVFDGDRAQETAEQVRGYHTNIKGVDKWGRRCRALDPDTFYWAHATFFTGVARDFVWLTVGMYDQPVRDLLGYSWSTRETKIHAAIGKVVNALFQLVPWRYRYQPRARAGWDRARGRAASDAPIVHTPARNLPPVTQRDNPMHYSPNV